MSKEKERLSRLVSMILSAERCRPLKPCWREVGNGSLDSGWMCGSTTDESWLPFISELVVTPLTSELCLALFSEILSSEVRACSKRRPFSNSRSWPRKLKLGDMDGLRSFTNLKAGKKVDYTREAVVVSIIWHWFWRSSHIVFNPLRIYG